MDLADDDALTVEPPWQKTPHEPEHCSWCRPPRCPRCQEILVLSRAGDWCWNCLRGA